MSPRPGEPLDPEPRDGELAERLARERPVPRAAFRGALGRYLRATDPGFGPRPARLRAIAAGCLGGGLSLVALGALTALGLL